MTRGKNRRLRLIPSHLPLIRDKLVEYERVALKEEMAAHSQYERSMEAAWNFVNARSREIAAILEAQGIEARFRYPEDDEAGFQRLANTR